MDRALILDTSGSIGRVAVAEDAGILDVRVLAESGRHARDLPVAIKSMLDERGWKPRQISSLIACVGPGSYTGLRVGIAAAKAFAFATACRLFAVPLFDAIAMGIEPGDYDLAVIADALRGNLYVGEYGWTPEVGWKLREVIAIMASNEWASRLKQGTRVAGSGIVLVKELLAKRGIAMDESAGATPIDFLDAIRAHPERYHSDPWRIEPIYLRGSSAEEKRKQESAGNCK